jgi:hypothetical protein
VSPLNQKLQLAKPRAWVHMSYACTHNPQPQNPLKEAVPRSVHGSYICTHNSAESLSGLKPTCCIRALLACTQNPAGTRTGCESLTVTPLPYPCHGPGK